jgi:hypothetical protein
VCDPKDLIVRATRISQRLGLFIAFTAEICPAVLAHVPAPASADPNDTKIDEIIKKTQQQNPGRKTKSL